MLNAVIPDGVSDTDTYRAKARDLNARAEACASAAEAATFLELAAAWAKLADESETRASQPRAAEN